MGFWKKLATSAVSALAISACGVPMEGEESGELDTAESVEQALTICVTPPNYNHYCVMGSSCAATRTRSQILSCSPDSSDTTVIEVDSVFTERYVFSAYATFTAVSNPFNCVVENNRLGVRIQRRNNVNQAWTDVTAPTINPVWQNGHCSASYSFTSSSLQADYYRLRVKGIRDDGSPEGVTGTIVRAN